MTKEGNQLLVTKYCGNYDKKPNEFNSDLAKHKCLNNEMINHYLRNESHVDVDSYGGGHHNQGFLDSTTDLNDLSKDDNILIPHNDEHDNVIFNRQESPTLSIRSENLSIIINSDDSDIEIDEKIIKKTFSSNSLTLNPNLLTLTDNNNNSSNNNNKKFLQIDKDAKLMSEKIIFNKSRNNDAPIIPTPISIIGGLMQNLKAPTDNELKAATQQIGSIAVNNSSDITFGNKHFYEGPVTIQQILIKNTSKTSKIGTNKNENGDDDHGDTTIATNNINMDKLNETSVDCFNDFLCLKLGNVGKYAIFGIICILIIIITLAITHGKALFKSNILLSAPCSYNETELCLVKRIQWNARPIKLGTYVSLDVPVERVIIAHTVTDNCLNFEDCVDIVQTIQNFHIDTWEFVDIGYNFLIGGDGRVYEGRGWNMKGAHTKDANSNSLGVAFIGTFIDDIPIQIQLMAFEQLLEKGVRLKKLQVNYKIYGAKQFTATQSPGDALYELIQTWERWSNKTKVRR